MMYSHQISAKASMVSSEGHSLDRFFDPLKRQGLRAVFALKDVRRRQGATCRGQSSEACGHVDHVALSSPPKTVPLFVWHGMD